MLFYSCFFTLPRYLGHLYMAEAQVAMDKIADAIQLLNPELVVDISLTLPENKTEQGRDFRPLYLFPKLFMKNINRNSSLILFPNISYSCKLADFHSLKFLKCSTCTCEHY